MWEYEVLTAEKGGLRYLEELLNTQGGDGWELVAVVPHNGAGPCWLYFKRPKR